MNYLVLLMAALPIVLMALLSMIRGDFSKSQMERRGLRMHRYPFVTHWAMWSDLLIMPFVIEIMWRYRVQWQLIQFVVFGSLSFVLSYWMTNSWIKNNPSDHNIVSKRSPTWAGILHAFYMTAVMTVCTLFYLYTRDIEPSHVLTVAVLLLAHVMICTIGLEWYRIRRIQLPTVIGALAATIGLTISVIYRGQ